MKPPFGSIWLEPTPLKVSLPWRAQLVNYIGEFPTEDAAKKYVNAVVKERDRAALGFVGTGDLNR